MFYTQCQRQAKHCKHIPTAAFYSFRPQCSKKRYAITSLTAICLKFSLYSSYLICIIALSDNSRYDRLIYPPYQSSGQVQGCIHEVTKNKQNSSKWSLLSRIQQHIGKCLGIFSFRKKFHKVKILLIASVGIQLFS